MKQSKIKKIWNYYTDVLGTTILHPQYIIRRYSDQGILQAKKYAKGKLLDVGCGRMTYRAEFEKSGCEYIGLDHPKISRLYDSQIKPDILADIHKLPMKDNSYDTVLLFNVLSYVDKPEKGLSEINRVLKKGGKLIMMSSFMYPIYDVPYDKYRFTPSGITNLLEKTSFKIVHIEPRGNFIEFFILALQVFLFKRIQDILKIQKNFLGFISLIFFIPFAILAVIFGNIIAFLLQAIIGDDKKFYNYYPIDIFVIAERL